MNIRRLVIPLLLLVGAFSAFGQSTTCPSGVPSGSVCFNAGMSINNLYIRPATTLPTASATNVPGRIIKLTTALTAGQCVGGGTATSFCWSDGTSWFAVTLSTATGQVLNGGGRKWSSGTGTPEAAVVGSIGDLFTDVAGGATTTLYVKTSGNATNTGWTAK